MYPVLGKNLKKPLFIPIFASIIGMTLLNFMKTHKIKFLLSLFVATSFYIVISGYREGPGTQGWDCSGAETGLGNPTGCNAGGGCHSTSPTAGISVVLEMDSTGGIPTTHYVGGMTYTVKITGTNNTASNLPRYGFQISSIKGWIPQGTPTNEGTWKAPFPGSTHYAAPQPGNFTSGLVEHTAQLAPLSGTGSTGTVYSKTFNWTAPLTGTGAVSFWAALNAVNNNGSADAGDLWNTTHLTINEWGNNQGIDPIEQNSFSVNVFPNPVTDYATLNYTLKETTNLQIGLYDITGRQVSNLSYGEQSTGQHTQTINIQELHLKSGIYILIVNDGNTADSKKLIVQ
jgi:hypothetical protein